MSKKARQRISYVLERADKQAGGHIKGVQGLAVDRERSILYSGGRDGILCAWDLNLDLAGHPASSATESTTDASETPNHTKFRTQHLAHTNWICDLALVQNNTAVVTASQDQLVKLWRPHASQNEEPYKIGEHADYAKCVASPNPNATWIATGGLDRKVYMWDLNGGGKTQEIDTLAEEKPEKGSIYALSTTENVLAYGGPEKVLHLWDPRAGKRITKFSGHTDMIRCVMISAAGDTVMTGSGNLDQTVKIWSLTAGRCMHTLTMHNDSVFSLYSDHPELSVFYSADRSGLVVKTDIRGCEVDDGLSLAVAHEHDLVNRVVAAGDHIWTATPKSSINRWRNVDTGADIPLPELFRQHRASVSTNMPASTSTATAEDSKTKEISARSILSISNTARFPVHHELEIDPNSTELANAVEPIHHVPQETIEGQFGLVKHQLLADKRRVLTLDTAGDVLLWDLIQCKPIQSFGKKHLEDVAPLVHTIENVSPWCSVDTSSGNLTVVLEPFNCFDAEMYADELELDESVDFRDDQRINHGKWILRYLFANLIDEEIKRDQAHRRKLNGAVESRKAAAKAKPVTIQIPNSPPWDQAVESPTTPRAGGSQYMPMTPGMGIGLATPILPGVKEEGPNPLDRRTSAAGRPSQDRDDYFSNATNSITASQAAKPAVSPVSEQAEDKTNKSDDGKDKEKDKEKDKGDAKSPFGKKFRMGMSFGTKRLARSGSASVADKPAVVDEKSAESESSSNHEPEKEFDDNFLGVIQKTQDEYEKQLAEKPEKHVETKITPSLPNETPVLKLPPGTKVIIQEETSGGSAELYRGTVQSVGLDADQIEKCAPQWLGEVLLLNTIPQKEPVKVSFVLHPYPNSGLPALASADGNNRLNANKMLRVKKILAYVAERIDPTLEDAEDKSEEDPAALKPEEYLELYCNDQLLPINMTLATLRAYIWKGGNDVVLHYKANGKKEIPIPSPEAPDASEGDATSIGALEIRGAGDAQPAQAAQPPSAA